jgi:hypothetical protein
MSLATSNFRSKCWKFPFKIIVTENIGLSNWWDVSSTSTPPWLNNNLLTMPRYSLRKIERIRQVTHTQFPSTDCSPHLVADITVQMSWQLYLTQKQSVTATHLKKKSQHNARRQDQSHAVWHFKSNVSVKWGEIRKVTMFKYRSLTYKLEHKQNAWQVNSASKLEFRDKNLIWMIDGVYILLCFITLLHLHPYILYLSYDYYEITPHCCLIQPSMIRTTVNPTVTIRKMITYHCHNTKSTVNRKSLTKFGLHVSGSVGTVTRLWAGP